MTALIYFFLKTQLGHSYAVYGNNPQFSDIMEFQPPFVYYGNLCLPNACAGLSGYLFAQTNNFVELNMGVVRLCYVLPRLFGQGVRAKQKTVFAQYTVGRHGATLRLTVTA